MPNKKTGKDKAAREKEQLRRIKAYQQMMANNQYKKDHYERITLLVKKGEKQRLNDLAKAEGRSLSSYILSFVPQKEEEEKKNEEQDNK